MDSRASLKHMIGYLNSQWKETNPGWAQEPGPHRASVTFSRQAGARGHSIGIRLAKLLQAKNTDGLHPWLLFDQGLVEEVIKEHHLPLSSASYMHEEQPVGEIEGLLGEILGLHPSTSALIQKTNSTIRRLARMGHVLIMGRGSNYLTREMKQVIQIRLVGSLAKRVRHLMRAFGLSQTDAESKVRQLDKARAAYVHKHLSRDIDDPLGYDFILNTDHYSSEEAAQFILEAVRHREQFLNLGNPVIHHR